MELAKWIKAALGVSEFSKNHRASGHSREQKIFLHIGRNKAGSTTLQDFFLDHRAELQSHGVRYALFGHLKDSVPDVVGFGHQSELAAYARAHPSENILISNEFIFHWPRIYTDSMIDGLEGFDVTVIACLRPYGSWLCSSYAQDIRSGASRCSFDAYYEQIKPSISAWQYLEPWGEGLGWDKIQVLSIDGRNTSWNSLVDDCLSALDIEACLGLSMQPRNEAPHWAVIELLRRLAERNQNMAWNAMERDIMVPLGSLLEECLTGYPARSPRTQYLTKAQAAELDLLYKMDIARINRCTGTELLLPPAVALPERPFLPGLSNVPAEILRDFAACAQAPIFATRHPAAAAAAQNLDL
jgi:hypothetical protein